MINNNFTEKVWYVTGTSTGLGFDLLQILLNQGHKVAAITRYPEQTVQDLKNKGTKNLNSLLAIKTDITSDQSVKESVEKAIEKFGRIDVVVNNSAYGTVGAVEEVSAEDVQKIYAVNVFGVYHVLRNVSPYLRKQKSGLVLNISSALGSANIGAGSYSLYESTKHALNALTIAYELEMRPLNVNVILVCPGGIRTSFVTGNNFVLPKNKIPEYNTQALIDIFNNNASSAPSSSEKVAQVVYDLSITPSDKLPKQLYLGGDSLKVVKSTLEKEIDEINRNEKLSLSTNI